VSVSEIEIQKENAGAGAVGVGYSLLCLCPCLDLDPCRRDDTAAEGASKRANEMCGDDGAAERVSGSCELSD
jgi:hypothetical protein